MSPGVSPPPEDADAEIYRLIHSLHKDEQRLEDLTAGEVDAVSDRDGRTFMLARAQEHLRLRAAEKQAAILNALPAHIALLDTRGLIVSVNDGWRRFASANALQGSGNAIGLDYLEVCDNARGEGSIEAHRAAAGIRSVLGGTATSFSMEYPCHSPTEQRWFEMMISPLADGHPHGAVVMHLDVTARRQTAESLRASELRFRQIAENIDDVFFLQDLDGARMHYVSPAYEQIWGRTCDSLYADPASWGDAIHPDDRDNIFREYAAGRSTGFDSEFRIIRPDGALRWIHVRGFPILDDAGNLYRTAGIASDITQRKQDMQELSESNQRFRELEENSRDVFFVRDPGDFRMLYVSPAYEEIWGRSRESLYANPKSWIEAIHPDDRDATAAKYEQAMQSGTFEFDYRIVRPDGSVRSIESIDFPVRNAAGAIVRITGVAKDITQRKEADRRIAYLNRVYALLSGINTLIVRVNDRDELFHGACRLAVETGAFRMAMIGLVDRSTMTIAPVATAGKDAELRASIKGILLSVDGASMTMVARAVREKKVVVSSNSERDSQVLFGRKYAEFGVRSKAILPLIVAGEVVGVFALYAAESEFFHEEEEVTVLMELASDIGFAIDHIESQEKLHHLAYYDALTGLANRSLFIERVAQYVRSAVADGHKLTLYMVDLQRFKNINDSLGRTAGDALLRQVAEWLAHRVGDAALVARLGADVFAVVLPRVKPEGSVVHLLEKTVEAFMEHPFHLDGAVFRVTVRVGAAIFPEDGADAEVLLDHAEAALKKAKASRERYLFYTPAMTGTVAARLTLETQLRQALENEEFVLHYQPKVNLQTGKLTGVEALIRWKSPRTGLVPPGQFIPVLEETGLIFEVGRWALHKAVTEHLRWRQAGLAALRIAVNVSPLQLRHSGFIADIEKAIGVDPHAAAGLELEMTESLVMENVLRSIASLQAIRTLGIRIAIDDFGTGFSSLSYLAKLPVDTLKIDRSFVADMTTGPKGLALVSTVITLAHALNLTVVAEGVETDEQSRLLRLLSCDEMQGFLFSKPVPSEIFEARFLASPQPTGEQQ